MVSRRRCAHLAALAVVGAFVLSSCSSGGSNASSSGGTGTSTTKAGGGSFGSADPVNAAAPDATQAAYTPTGPLIADDGFRPTANSFPIENYGDKLGDGSTPTNLTPDDGKKLLGPSVCVDANAGKCDLTPEAQKFMDQTNAAMAGGHCYGFSVSSLLFWTGQVKPSDFGGANAPALTIPGNTALQREIAYTWAFQKLTPVLDGTIKGSPNDIIAKLKTVLVPNPPETYTIGIFKRDGSGGHAVTPYAIEDAGGGILKILIYDNNYPKVTRAITVDSNANTWKYDAAINPNVPSEVYEGDATTQSMQLMPTNAGLAVGNPFSGKAPSAGSAGNSGAGAGALGTSTTQAETVADVQSDQMDQIWLDGGDTEHAHLLITDSAGHKLGYDGGTLVNQIPGANYDLGFQDETWLTTQEPTYYVPDGTKFTITVDGTPLKNADNESVTVIGPYFDLSVSSINVHPGEKDTINVGADGAAWSFQSSQPQMPEIGLGISDDTTDWAFDIKGDQVPANSTINVALPGEGGTMTFGTASGAGQGSFTLAVDRLDENGITHFEHSGIQLSGGDTASLAFGSWQNGQPMTLSISQGGGAPQSQSLSDQG